MSYRALVSLYDEQFNRTDFKIKLNDDMEGGEELCHQLMHAKTFERAMVEANKNGLTPVDWSDFERREWVYAYADQSWHVSFATWKDTHEVVIKGLDGIGTDVFMRRTEFMREDIRGGEG